MLTLRMHVDTALRLNNMNVLILTEMYNIILSRNFMDSNNH
jgi:hypothetical protein